MALSAPTTNTTPPSPTGCATPDPFIGIPGLVGVCVDGNWVPSGHPLAFPSHVAAPAQPSPPTGSALLWVMVIEESGVCIDGATIQAVGLEGAGEPIPQMTPCTVWDYDGGLFLRDLTPGVELTLRAAASGYAPREMSFLPFPLPGPIVVVSIELSVAESASSFAGR